MQSVCLKDYVKMMPLRKHALLLHRASITQGFFCGLLHVLVLLQAFSQNSQFSVVELTKTVKAMRNTVEMMGTDEWNTIPIFQPTFVCISARILRRHTGGSADSYPAYINCSTCCRCNYQLLS